MPNIPMLGGSVLNIGGEIFQIGAGSTVVPTSVQLIMQGQNHQGQSAGTNTGNYTVNNPNAQTLGWKSVAGATSYNIYRSTTTTPGTNSAYTLYATGITAATATSNYSSYVSNSGTPGGTDQGGHTAGGMAPGIDSCWQDIAANNCLNGTLGPTSNIYFGPINGYTYTVTAVVGGVESTQSAPNIAILIANGNKVFYQDTFNNLAIVAWSQATSSNSPLGFANSMYVQSANDGSHNYINPYTGWSSPQENFGVAGYNYINIGIYPLTTIPANTFSFSSEVDGDLFLYSPELVYFTPPAGQWSTFKLPLWTAGVGIPNTSGNTPAFLVPGSGNTVASGSVGVPQPCHYKTSWVNGGSSSTFYYYLEVYFSVD